MHVNRAYVLSLYRGSRIKTKEEYHIRHYNQILTGVLGGPTDVFGGPCPCCGLGCFGVVETIPVKQNNTQCNDFKHWSG